MDFDVNYLAAIVATVVHQIIGALWYGVLFRDRWLTAMGMSREQVQQEGGGFDSTMLFGAVCSLLECLGIAFVLSLEETPSLGDGIAVGAIAGLLFIGAATYMNGLYEQKKQEITLIFISYQTVACIAAGAIIGAWQ